jgi:hypothetical protein
MHSSQNKISGKPKLNSKRKALMRMQRQRERESIEKMQRLTVDVYRDEIPDVDECLTQENHPALYEYLHRSMALLPDAEKENEDPLVKENEKERLFRVLHMVAKLRRRRCKGGDSRLAKRSSFSAVKRCSLPEHFAVEEHLPEVKKLLSAPIASTSSVTKLLSAPGTSRCVSKHASRCKPRGELRVGRCPTTHTMGSDGKVAYRPVGDRQTDRMIMLR